MDIYLLFYFLTGIAQDFLLTLNWRFIGRDRVVPAAVFSFVSTIVGFAVLYNILTRLNEQRGIAAIVAYALGIGTGTILGMKMKIASKN